MLKYFIEIGCIFVCTDVIASVIAMTIYRSINLQGNENSVERRVIRRTGTSGFPSLNNGTSLKMLDDITTKVWKVLPVIEIPRTWVLDYCTKYTEISEQIEKASMQCQYIGTTDWDCTFVELGGGRDDFNMGKIVSSFHEVSDGTLRSKLLRGAEICAKFWQRYKNVQEQRLIRMQLTVHANDRKKRHLTKDSRSPDSKSNRKKSKKKKKKKKTKQFEELKKKRLIAKEEQEIRRSLISKITGLENKKRLNPEEEKELDRLHLTVTTKPRNNLEEYPLTGERAELSRLQEVGLCLSRETAKACESVVLDVVGKLI